jgi:hypothetical protein
VRLVWILPGIAAACYAPSPPAGAPCAPGEQCPGDLVCVNQICRDPGGDVPPDDAPVPPDDARPDGPANDVDGDGILNDVDDCPDDFDPKQFNEDGDRFGDVCDPCPPIANDTPVDGDLDGVSDDCDPNPGAGGDKLFEGFNEGVPVGWIVFGAWTAGAGFVSVDVDNLNDAELGPPGAVDNRSTVVVGFTPTSANNGATGVGPMHYTATPREGILCSIFQDGGQATRAAGIIDLDVDFILDESQYSWSVNTTYTMKQLRRDNQYTCTIRDPQKVVGGSSGEVAATSNIEMFTRGISGRLLWLMYIDSP